MQSIKLKWKQYLLGIAIPISLYVLARLFMPGILLSAMINPTETTALELKNKYELELVNDDLMTYGYISDRVCGMIKLAMEKASIKYRIPIGLMHGIFRVESEYRYTVTHPTVTVSVKGKKHTTNAVGLGGIMWCFWGDSLRANHIADTELDLYLPDVNVEASAYILRTLIDDEAINNAALSRVNILDNVVRRYYGEYNDLYIAKMTRITSDLWMKRIAKDLIMGIKSRK